MNTDSIQLIQDEHGTHWVAAHIRLQLTREGARVPTYAHGPQLDNGVDLYAAEDVIVAPGETAVVPLGFKLALPPGYGLFVLPRSGLSLKTTLRVANGPGLIDHGFREEAGVIVWNTASRDNPLAGPGAVRPPLKISKGDRIAQAVLIHTPVMQFSVVDDLGETERGAGFGSSGVNDVEAGGGA